MYVKCLYIHAEGHHGASFTMFCLCHPSCCPTQCPIPPQSPYQLPVSTWYSNQYAQHQSFMSNQSITESHKYISKICMSAVQYMMPHL